MQSDEYNPSPEWVDGRESAFSEIREERRRQLMKWGLRGSEMDDATFLKVLVEEVGEVAKAMLEGKPDEMRTEIIQAAAVCAAKIQQIDTGVQ